MTCTHELEVACSKQTWSATVLVRHGSASSGQTAIVHDDSAASWSNLSIEIHPKYDPWLRLLLTGVLAFSKTWLAYIMHGLSSVLPFGLG